MKAPCGTIPPLPGLFDFAIEEPEPVAITRAIAHVGEPAATPPSIETFDPAEWLELPGPAGGFVSRRPEPCSCGCQVFDLVEVRPGEAGKSAWSGLCCRDCVTFRRLVSIEKQARIARLGTLDRQTGELVIFGNERGS